MATAAPDGFAVFECRHDNISKDLMVAQGTPQVEIAQTLCQLFGLPPQYAGRLRVSVHGTDAVLSSKIPSGVVIDVDSPGAAGVAPQRRPRGPRGASKMTIGVKLQTDKTVWLEVRPGTIIKDVKGMLQDREGVPPDQQRYVFGGKQLLDDTSMLECGVKGGGVMHMVLRLRGC